MHAVDRLIDAVIRLQNPTVLGLDTRLEYVPEALWDPQCDDLEAACDAIFEYNKQLIDGLCDQIPAVKVQIAFYEQYGPFGMIAFRRTEDYAAKAGMVVIADAKRGDIGSTAEGYADAFLRGASFAGGRMEAFPADFLTVNPYFGIDGIKPFADACKTEDKGIFVLVKTSNPSGGQFQDLLCDGKPLYVHVADRVAEWGADNIGAFGYSAVGAVVGATYPEQGAALRKHIPQTFFLVPGYGAQGGSGASLAGCFDDKGRGAVVNASRSLLCAYKKQPQMHYIDAARMEAIRMQNDLCKAVGGTIR